MQLLDMQNMSEGQSNSRVYIVEALWNPNAHSFEVLNTETPKGTFLKYGFKLPDREQCNIPLVRSNLPLFRDTRLHDRRGGRNSRRHRRTRPI